MLVKELKKQLKGKYTDVLIFNAKYKDDKYVAPYTMLGKEFNQLRTSKEMKQWIDNREVVSYELYKTGLVTCYSSSLEFKKQYQGIDLMIYVKI